MAFDGKIYKTVQNALHNNLIKMRSGRIKASPDISKDVLQPVNAVITAITARTATGFILLIDPHCTVSSRLRQSRRGGAPINHY